MKKSKLFLICGIALLVISIVFTGLIALKIDNRSFMPTCISGETPKENTGCCYTTSCPTCADVINTCGETTISFASLNLPVRDKISSNYILYKITNYLGYLPFLVVLGYCVLGFIQLIKNKSFKKVEKGLRFCWTSRCHFHHIFSFRKTKSKCSPVQDRRRTRGFLSFVPYLAYDLYFLWYYFA